MSKGYRRSLLFLMGSALLMFAFGASAQLPPCSSCDPYNSSCSQACQWCVVYGYEGCESWEESTCGSGVVCIPDNCTPSWSETSRVTQGTYDGNSWQDCDHHSVQWVTLTDSHHCNNDSDFWTQSYCDNVIDGHKYGFFPDCCDGYGPYGADPLYTCNGYHYCTG